MKWVRKSFMDEPNKGPGFQAGQIGRGKSSRNNKKGMRKDKESIKNGAGATKPERK